MYMYVFNYRKEFPGLSEEIYAVLENSDQKMKYDEYERKRGRLLLDEKACRIQFIPGREDSLERLMGMGRDFAANQNDIENEVLATYMSQKLHNCLYQLTEKELQLIQALYYEKKSERTWSSEVGIPQKTINNRRKRILAKLLKMMLSQ